MPRWFIPIPIAAIMFACAAHGRVQTATPTPDTPPPGLCHVPPRPFQELQAIIATPIATPPAQPIRTTVPKGTPADPETIAGITATLRELIACFNAGEVLRAYSLYTPDYLRRIFSTQDPLTPATYDALA